MSDGVGLTHASGRVATQPLRCTRGLKADAPRGRGSGGSSGGEALAPRLVEASGQKGVWGRQR